MQVVPILQRDVAGPLAPETGELARRLDHDLANRVRALVDAGRRVRDGEDEEAIHDLRVAARRLQAALRLWRDLLDPGSGRRAGRRARALRRRAGRTRELEVNQAQLAAITPELPPPARAVAETLLARLTRRRERARARATGLVSPGRLTRIASLTTRAREALPAAAAGVDTMREPRARLLALRRECAEAVTRAATSGEDADLHRARIAGKKLRYALESLDAAFGRESRLDPLRDLQHALGRVHDRAMLEVWVTRRVRKLRGHGAVTAAQALEPLLERISRDRHEWIERFRGQAASLDLERLVAAPVEPRPPAQGGTPPAP